jgi:Cof subfamily protein (haloacid dehalogenase superfamily)
VAAIATDLDYTVLGSDLVLHPRTVDALQRAHAAGIHVIVATGRMVRALLPVIAPVGLDEPVVCYQGAVVAQADGTFLQHHPIELGLAREVIAAVSEAGYPPNVYVGDELYVERMTPRAERYGNYQNVAVHPVGDLTRWLSEPPTKLVCMGVPDDLDRLGERLSAQFSARLWISKSIPIFLEFAAAGVSKASGAAYIANSLGFSAEQTVAFGDAPNDIELLEWAGYAVAVENAHPRLKAVSDWVCPAVDDEGVASVIEALLDARRS